MKLAFATAVSVSLLLYSPVQALAQEASAGITGRVTDPTGAGVVGAAVVARDEQRGTEWPTKTNEEGIFAFPRIPVGTYEVRVEAPGFKTFVQPHLTLELNQRARVDAPLEVGAVSEQISVSADAA